MAAHYDLVLRNGTCVLAWGAEATDVAVRAAENRRAGCRLRRDRGQDF